MRSVLVYAPASIGNVSVGFDVLGAAISPIDGTLLGDSVEVVANETERFTLECRGDFASSLPENPKENIVYLCYEAFCRAMDARQCTLAPVTMTLEKNMPIGSGLGSSACSIVAALDALNRYHHNPLDETSLLTLMGEMEGVISGSIHYDNVAPCYLGGMQLILEQQGHLTQSIPCFQNWYWVMAYPGIKTATAQARAILPTHYRLEDVVSHGRHIAGFIHACYSNQPRLAAAMLKDVVAEPYRETLLPNFAPLRDRIKAKGALATGISGSGPTIFAITDNLKTAQDVKHLLHTEYIQNDQGFVHICQLNTQGSTQVGGE